MSDDHNISRPSPRCAAVPFRLLWNRARTDIESTNMSGRIGTFVTIPDEDIDRRDGIRGQDRRQPERNRDRPGDIRPPYHGDPLIGTIRGDTFTRGLASYPHIGASVLGADPAKLKSIFSAHRGMDFSFGVLPCSRRNDSISTRINFSRSTSPSSARRGRANHARRRRFSRRSHRWRILTSSCSIFTGSTPRRLSTREI